MTGGKVDYKKPEQTPLLKKVKREGCGNCYFRKKKFAGTRGNPRAPIVFVGESPGVLELTDGVPFIGPSGKVLDDCLPDTMTEEDYYVTNAMVCSPRKGGDQRKNTEALRNACIRCHDRLIEEISAHPRKVIVALGNAAIWSLTRDTSHKITASQGKLFPSHLAERGIVAAVHPAYLLRGGGSYRKFKSHIQYALDLAMGLPEKRAIVPTWNVAETLSDVYDFIDYTFERSRATGLRDLGADIETDGFDHIDNRMLSIGWGLEEDEVFEVEEDLLYHPDQPLKYRDFDKAQLYGGYFDWGWHNGKFDVKFMRRAGYRSAVDSDTMLMSYAMEEKRGYHDLEQIANDELGAPDYKAMLKPWVPTKKHSYRNVPKPVLNKYLALDVSDTRQILPRYATRIQADTKCTTLYNKVLLPASECLADVEDNGMEVDWDVVSDNEKYYVKEIQEKKAVINEIALKLEPTLTYKVPGRKKDGGGVIAPGLNPNAPNQVAHLLYDLLKLGHSKMGTGKDVLEKLPNHEAVKALKEYRKAAKAYGTYVKSLRDQVSSDGRVHCTYLIHGTATGRLSSRGPNMQNQPRGPRIRGQFRAAEGNIIVEIDLSQAELRCLAALSGDPDLCHIYNTEGLSLHKEVAMYMSDEGIIGKDWAQRYKLNDPNNFDYQEAYEEYMRIKALNFGIVYGRTAPSIADEFDIPTEEAQLMIDGWANRFETAWKYIGRCRRAPLLGQNLTTPFGRRKRAGIVSREKLTDLQNEAANFPHQSIASDITLTSACEIRPQLKDWGVKIVNIIHDAILLEMPDDDELFYRSAKYGTSVMTRKPTEWGLTRVPFASDAKRGLRWGDLKEVNLEDYAPKKAA